MSTTGISGFVYTKTSITIKFTSGSAYRYDVSEVMSQAQLKEMIALAKAGKGLNTYLNANQAIRKHGYVDTTLVNSSFTKYGS